MTRRDEAEEQAIREYVASQGVKELTRLEKLNSRRIGPDRFDVWDVWTDEGRWYVVTPGTNLYLQEDFQSYEIALTYHVGLWHVLRARDAVSPTPKDQNRGPAAWRKWEQAADALEDAEEAEDFQAVGMRLREGLLTFLRGIVADEFVPEGSERPKAADFLQWTKLIADHTAAGKSRAELRRHLREFARTTWQLVNWLTHAANATRSHGLIALTACDHLAAAYVAAVAEYEQGEPLRCPECGSYQLKTFYPTDREDVTICAACDAEV